MYRDLNKILKSQYQKPQSNKTVYTNINILKDVIYFKTVYIASCQYQPCLSVWTIAAQCP